MVGYDDASGNLMAETGQANVASTFAGVSNHFHGWNGRVDKSN